MNEKITVIDSMMGSGKTSWALQHINDNPKTSFVFITPFLSEIDRVVAKTNGRFKAPVNRGNGKLDNFNSILAAGHDIAATHELFKHINDESKQLIKQSKYTLILDEVLNVVEVYNDIKPDDIKLLEESECISIDKNKHIVWNQAKEKYDTKYNALKFMAENNSLISLDGKNVIWQFPPDIFKIFSEIYILTYRFKSSLLRCFFDLHHIKYCEKYICKSETKYYLSEDNHENAALKDIVSKIKIYDGKLNLIEPDKRTQFSKSWFESAENTLCIKRLKNNLFNYFKHKQNAKSDEILWTSFKGLQHKLSGRGYTKAFLPCNCRSVNEYADRRCLAYCLNVFVNPIILNYFLYYNVYLNEDSYALTEMLQWIWRSGIRNGESINIYIPSARMRNLLEIWINKYKAS